MRRNLRTWIVVADSARAKLFLFSEDEAELDPAELPGLPEAAVHRHARDVKSDRPGRTFASAGNGTRHAIEPHHDPHKLEKHDFAVALADSINRSAESRAFDRLVLVAPSRTLGELRGMLSRRVRESMLEIAKDLTKAPLSKLQSEVREAIRSHPRAGGA